MNSEVATFDLKNVTIYIRKRFNEIFSFKCASPVVLTTTPEAPGPTQSSSSAQLAGSEANLRVADT